MIPGKSISNFLLSTLISYTNIFRQTGRTTNDLMNLRGGEVYVVHNSRMREFVLNWLRQHDVRGVTIVAANGLTDLSNKLRGTRFTRIVFDHVFLELHWRQVILDNEGYLDHFVKDVTRVCEPPKRAAPKIGLFDPRWKD